MFETFNIYIMCAILNQLGINEQTMASYSHRRIMKDYSWLHAKSSNCKLQNIYAYYDVSSHVQRFSVVTTTVHNFVL